MNNIPDFPVFMRKRLERALYEAQHPKGMSLHDGKVTILGLDLRRLLDIAIAVENKRKVS